MPKVFEEAKLSGELRLSGRKLKDFPKTAAKYNLTDTVIAGRSLHFILFHFIMFYIIFYGRYLFVSNVLRLFTLKLYKTKQNYRSVHKSAASVCFRSKWKKKEEYI